MKPSQVLMIIAMVLIAFFAGAAWKSADTTQHQELNSNPDQQFVSVSDEVRETAPPKELGAAETATINLFKGAAPSVVYITTLNVRRNSWSRNVLEIPSGSGSGFVWNEDGTRFWLAMYTGKFI